MYTVNRLLLYQMNREREGKKKATERMLFPSQENARWFVRSILRAFSPLYFFFIFFCCLVDSSAAHFPVGVADERLGEEIVSTM